MSTLIIDILRSDIIKLFSLMHMRILLVLSNQLIYLALKI